ncbi:hypothetical protein NV226_02250 [Mycoplasma iguanae]|uniref:Fibronectin type-III domain-containing protein n=1 Tax=Mycoplasma iguanae TaxID=292461 RepID=A0ABY5R7R4_9MOLU|nr:hypothetical protein [Mycoplasma iguanae]UVD81529.1 hypothetical protein NV226_02250 [Mycoplasma iguanae]
MKKNKKIVTAFLGIWSVLVISTAIAVPLAFNYKKSPYSDLNSFAQSSPIKTNVVNVSSTEVKLQLNDLDDFVNHILTLEYWQSNVAQNTNNNANTKALTKKLSVYITNETKEILIGNLSPDNIYSLEISSGEKVLNLTNNNKLTKTLEFSTFNKPEIYATSTNTTISITSSKLNKQFLKSNIVIMYKKYNTSADAPEDYLKSVKGIVSVDEKENENPDYIITGVIQDLEKGEPYVVYLQIEGQSSYFADPIIVWTKGGTPSFVTPDWRTFTIGIQASLGGIEDYIIHNDDKSKFFLRYWVEGETEKKWKEIDLKDISDGAFIFLKDLKPDTKYGYEVVQSIDGQDDIIWDKFKTFITKLEPTAQNVDRDLHDSFAPRDTSTPITPSQTVWVSSKRAKIQFGNIDTTTVEGAIPSQEDIRKGRNDDLIAILIPAPAEGQPLDWKSADAIRTSLINGEVNTNISGPGKHYLQLFNKYDTNFEAPFLETPIEFIAPDLFKIETKENVNKSKLEIKVSGINNVKSNEVALIWEPKDNTDESKRKVVLINDPSKDFTYLIEDLEPDTQYDIKVVPTLKSLSTNWDSFGEAKASTEPFIYVNKIAAKISDPITTIDLKGFTEKTGLIGKPLKLQWKTGEDNYDNNKEFVFTANSNEINNGDYSLKLPLTALKEINQNEDIEFRIVSQDDTNNWDQLQKGDKKIRFKETIYKFTAVERYLFDANLVEWHLPLNVKRATSWGAGQGYTSEQSGAENWGKTPKGGGAVDGDLFTELAKEEEEEEEEEEEGGTARTVYFYGAPAISPGEWVQMYQYLAFKGSEEQKNAFIKQFQMALWNNVKYVPNKDNVSASLQQFAILPFATKHKRTRQPQENPLRNYWNPGVLSAVIGNIRSNKEPDYQYYTLQFIDSNSKHFLSIESFKNAIKYQLEKITKNGFNYRNAYIKNPIGGELKEFYASQIDSIKKLKAFLKLADLLKSNQNYQYAIADENDTDAEKNIFANDVEGRLYFKVKATKKATSRSTSPDTAQESFSYWTYLDGFKKATEPIKPSDVYIARRNDSLATALILTTEYAKITDADLKKQYINEHFIVNVPSIFDWEVESLTINNNQKNPGEAVNAKIKIKPKAEVHAGTYKNKQAKAATSLTEQIIERNNIRVVKTVDPVDDDMTISFTFPNLPTPEPPAATSPAPASASGSSDDTAPDSADTTEPAAAPAPATATLTSDPIDSGTAAAEPAPAPSPADSSGTADSSSTVVTTRPTVITETEEQKKERMAKMKSKQVSNIKSQDGTETHRGVVLYNHTYDRLIIQFKEANIKKTNGDSSEYDKLVKKFVDALKADTELKSEMSGKKLYIRTALQAPFTAPTSNKRTNTDGEQIDVLEAIGGTADKDSLDPTKFDFFVSTSTYNSEDDFEKQIKEIIDQYGALYSPKKEVSPSTPAPATT